MASGIFSKCSYCNRELAPGETHRRAKDVGQGAVCEPVEDDF